MGITETYVSAGSQRFAACQPNRALCDRHHMQQRKTRCVWCRSFSAGEQPPLSASAVVARPKRDSALECKPAVAFGRAPDHITGYMAPHNSRAYAMLGPPLVLVPLCVNITGATETIVNP
jgi:hypothetical protein